MAHNLSKKDGKYTFAGRMPAWHGLGQIVNKVMTSEEAIREAGLDYEVLKQEIYINDTEGSQIVVPNQFATVRQDTQVPLGVVGNRYTVVQNSEAFQFFDAIVGEGQAIYETAGALGLGERIFISALLPETIIVGEDVIKKYLILCNAHDGSMGVTAFFSLVMPVCENTFNAAMSSRCRSVTIRHSSSVLSNLRNAHTLMGITKKESDLVEHALQQMATVQITDKQLKAYIEKVMQPGKEQISQTDFSKRFANTIDSVLQYAATDQSQLLINRKGTLYGAFNAITGFYSNVKGYKSAEERLDSVMFNSGARNNAKAFDLAIDFMDGKTKLDVPELILS